MFNDARCASCKRGVSHYSDEFIEWLWLENKKGEVTGALCPDCQSKKERKDVVRWREEMRRQRA